MYVSTYDPIFRQAFDNACAAFQAQEHDVLVKKITDAAHEAVEAVRHSIESDMASNMEDEICRRGAKVAEAMLEQALAGEDDTIRNLFGFYAGYRELNKYNMLDRRLPHQWQAINAIVAANPDLFREERFGQQEIKIQALEREVAKLYERIRGYEPL